MANTNNISGTSVNIYIDDAPARAAYERLVGKADAYNKKIQETEAKTKKLQEAIDRALAAGGKPTAAQKALDKLNATLATQRAELARNTAEQQRLQSQMDSNVGPSLRQQQQLVNRLLNEWKNLGQNTEEAQRKLQEYGAASRVLDQMQARLQSVRQTVETPPSDDKKGGFFGSFFGNLAAAGVAKLTGMVSGFFSESIDEANQADQATRRLHNTLENIGRMDAFDRITAKADEFAQHWKYLDNDDITGVYNKLIDYGKLTETQMNKLMPVIVDFAAKQSISLEESSSVIIKAMEGNGKALKEYGIHIDTAGTHTDRLQQIMTVLKSKVDGAGDAFMNSAEGGMAVAKQQLADTKEEIGKNLIPALGLLLGAFNKLLIGLNYIGSAVKSTFGDIQALFSGGFEGLRQKWDNDKLQRRLEFEGNVVKESLKTFENKTTKEVSDAIQKINGDLAGKLALTKAFEKRGESSGITQEDYDRNMAAVRMFRQELEGLYKLQDTHPEGTLGIDAGDEESPEAKQKREEAERKRKQALEKIKNDQKALTEFLRKQALAQEEAGQSEYLKAFIRLQGEYEEKRRLAHGDKQLLLQLEESYQVSLRKLVESEIKKGQEQKDKLDRETAEKADKAARARAEKISKDAAAHLAQMNAEVQASAQRQLTGTKDRLALDVLRKHGFARLEAQKAQLDLEEKQAIAAAEKSGGSVELVEEQYRQKKREAEIAFYTQMASTILGIAQGVADLAGMDNQVKTAQENAELARQKRRNETEKDGHKKLLNGKLISQQEYNRRAKALDDQYRAQEAAAKKRQWERQQRADVASAMISGAQAVLSALQTKPFWLGLVMAGIAAVKTKKQIDTIKAQPAPEFEQGGILSGPRHKHGGLPVINPVTGAKVAEMEGGEAILSRKTVANNPELVGALLQSSMRQGGARISPAFLSRDYQALDYSGLSRSIQNVRYYENGGTWPDGGTSSSPGTGAVLQVVAPENPEQTQLLRGILTVVSQPQRNYVVYQDIQDAGSTLADIQEQSTFSKGK